MTLTDSDRDSISAALGSLCPSWPTSEVEVEQYLAGGYRNRNYQLRYNDERYVLRIASRSETDFVREQKLLGALTTVFPATCDGLTLKVATTIASSVEDGLLLSRFSSAPLLASCYGVPAETLGVYLARLHSCIARLPDSVVSSGNLRSNICSDLTLASGSKELAERCVAVLPKPKHASAVCHLDLNPWNLLVRQNHWLTLDWETVARADPLFDLVTLCDGYLREHGLQADRDTFSCAALRAYNHALGKSQENYTSAALDEARIWYQWREYSWACAQLTAGNQRDEIVLQRDFFAAELVKRGFDIIPS